MRDVIGITGYAQHGKNTVAEVLEEFGYRPVGFADRLRDLAYRLNPIAEIDYGGSEIRYREVLDKYGYEQAKRVPEFRRILQELGTGIRDELGPDVWVDALRRTLVAGQKYVITDVRFPNEAAMVKDTGGELWRVSRPGFDNGIGTEHASEMHVASLPVDRELLNVGDLEHFKALVRTQVEARV